jgi:hypothetical protein
MHSRSAGAPELFDRQADFADVGSLEQLIADQQVFTDRLAKVGDRLGLVGAL